MDYFEINGLKKLNGLVEVSGAKNAVLPLMAAAILNRGNIKISNVPTLSDSITMSKLLEEMGAKVQFSSNNSISVDSSNWNKPFAPYDLVKTMRASFYVLGPLIARFGEAKVSLPGGCAWGPRPVDFHLDGLKALGVKISIENILSKIKDREEAKKAGNYKLADQIRDDLDKEGIDIKDEKGKTIWNYKWAKKKYTYLIPL